MKFSNILPKAKKQSETTKKQVTEEIKSSSAAKSTATTTRRTGLSGTSVSSRASKQVTARRSSTTPARRDSNLSRARTSTTRTTNASKDTKSSTVISYHDHPDQRVAVFVDSANLYHSAKALYRSRLNFEAVLRDSVRARKLIRAFAYVIRSEGGDEDKFFKALIDLGFETREKDLKVFHSGAKKADWDVGIAMDVVRMVPKVDVVVLFSGDGDFVECVRYAQAQGVLVEVVSFGKSTSAELIEVADHFLDLDKSVRKYTFLK